MLSLFCDHLQIRQRCTWSFDISQHIAARILEKTDFGYHGPFSLDYYRLLLRASTKRRGPKTATVLQKVHFNSMGAYEMHVKEQSDTRHCQHDSGKILFMLWAPVAIFRLSLHDSQRSGVAATWQSGFLGALCHSILIQRKAGIAAFTSLRSPLSGVPATPIRIVRPRIHAP